MAFAEYTLAYARVWSPAGYTVARVWSTIDEADFLPPDIPGDPPGDNPDPEAELGPEIVIEITGPGRVRVDAWRSNQAEGQAPWRSTDEIAPDGLTAADSPMSIATGGPVRFVKSVRVRATTL